MHINGLLNIFYEFCHNMLVVLVAMATDASNQPIVA